MKIGQTIIWMTALASIFSAGCETIDSLGIAKPTAKMTGLKFANASWDSATLMFDVEVDNPYTVALPLLNMNYGLSSGAEPFVSGSADLQETIPAKSKKTVTLPAKVNYKEMLSALKGIKPGSKIPYKANLGLSVDAPVVGTLKLPMNKEGEMTLPKVSDVNVKSIWDAVKQK
ncbi:MAG: LEA type 2 family protein [Sedimentisphaerales bacterium]|nr:LEA type 2 family protein [Sedimentisphaerales bacterium]